MEEALEFAGRVARACSVSVGDELASVILHGSLTLGDYVPGQSDIDLLAVVEAPLPAGQLAALQDAVSAEAPGAPARFDLRVVTREVAAAPTPAPPVELYVAVHREGLQVERGVPEPDLVVELSICRAHGRSLMGGDPAQLLAEVPARWVVDVGDAQLARWQELEYEPRFGELMAFTACRVWRFAEEGVHCSKAAAAEWALRRDPALQAVRDALRRRRLESMLPLEEAPVRELLAAARAHVAEARVAP